MKTIMILGAGVMQLPGIRLAKQSGWRVIVADGNMEALGSPLADHFEAVDLKDKDGLLAVARQYHTRYGLDGVFTAGTDFSSSVAWVSEKMGLPGITFEAAMRATDKCLMREAFQRAGVPSPGIRVLVGLLGPRCKPWRIAVPPRGQAGRQHGRPRRAQGRLTGGIAGRIPLGSSAVAILPCHCGGVHGGS